jgi:hypothetical protein
LRREKKFQSFHTGRFGWDLRGLLPLLNIDGVVSELKSHPLKTTWGSGSGCGHSCERAFSPEVAAKGITNRADDVHQARKIAFASGGGRLARGLENVHDVWCRYAGEGGVNRSVEDCSVPIEDEHGREGYPALLARIVDTPILDHAFIGVAENREA